MIDLLKESDFLLEIGIAIIAYIPFVIYVINRILNNKNISSTRKKVYLVIACINPLFALLFYSIEANRRLKEKYSSKLKDENRPMAEL
ncbi:hypothetical protein M2451_000579 [Dysgonomonas sp. PFB1-18]|uniref:hypothetical protein n=1 Tax=unclassified Dysgonomonas TaxID=2630389 RepID=UPI002473DED2|nr:MULTISPECIES: hypothetical protein [unclassified Dysgonomonas]MDH6307430.1 hypothetical protein [Dysgonomonas sp. PF1-14]MDH6337348.1 hypothetical protein [Dysgonomonas sp. PF1-16]MDH6379272.1 hypothetical protein [Dysgonomonas sp. PFB1-18]MDH6396090.1 hypothetical protein [Dysgonomonas sp. PF1-23]